MGDECTVSKLAMMLEVLMDGEWHGIEELQKVIELNEHQVREITSFLYEYDFAKMDDANKRVKIHKRFQEFLTQT